MSTKKKATGATKPTVKKKAPAKGARKPTAELLVTRQVYMPKRLVGQVEELASSERRSWSAQVVTIVERFFDGEGRSK